jgi:hypothetical protein
MRTNPIGVRFDPEKLEFVKSREKLTTNQQVVDLLMNRYWWENKMPIPTHKEAPPLHLKEVTVVPYAKEIEEPLSFEQLRQEVAVKDPKSDFERRLRAAECAEDLQSVGRDIERSSLPRFEKQRLQALGQAIFNDKFNF